MSHNGELVCDSIFRDYLLEISFSGKRASMSSEFHIDVAQPQSTEGRIGTSLASMAFCLKNKKRRAIRGLGIGADHYCS